MRSRLRIHQADALGYSITQDHLPFLRLFTLNSFISLLLDLLLLSLISLTLFSSSSSSLPSSICSLLSSTDLSLDLFGYSLESCEERFGSFVLSAMGFTAAVAVCRAWGSVKTLEYYEALAKRQRRKLPSLSIASPNRYRDSAGEHYSATTPSSTSKRHQPSQRILLLPAESATSGKRDDSIPLLSLTAASPSRTSFPPIPHASTSSLPATEADETRYLVYAPVSFLLLPPFGCADSNIFPPSPLPLLCSSRPLIATGHQVFMTPDEARRVGAREIHISSSSSSSHGHRPRSRSTASPSKHSASSGLSQGGGSAMETPSEESLVTPIAEETEEEQRRMVVGSSANGKGKQA